jgi:hypothetical protein
LRKLFNRIQYQPSAFSQIKKLKADSSPRRGSILLCKSL